MASDRERWLVRPEDPAPPGQASTPGRHHGAPGDKEVTRAAQPVLAVRLGGAPGALYAESERSLLVVLQGMDTSGKGGTISTVFAA